MPDVVEPQHPYQPGDVLRVIVDEPYSTELHAGDVVTVEATAWKAEPDGTERPIVVVATNRGQRLLYLDVVEPVTTYRPAEPDEVVDGIFERMIRADRDLLVFAQDADTALGATDPQVSTQLGGHRQATPAEAEATGWEQPGGPEANYFPFTDYAGDSLEVYYAEHPCPEHGREGAFFFITNEEPSETVLIPASLIGQLIRFLVDRHRFSNRPGEGTV